MAVKSQKMRPNTGQIYEAINRPQQVVLWDVSFERELIKQCRLRLQPRFHHR